MKGRILPAEDPAAKVGAETAVWLDLPIVDHGEEVIEVRGVLGANMALRADALARVGLFDERLGPGAAGPRRSNRDVGASGPRRVTDRLCAARTCLSRRGHGAR